MRLTGNQENLSNRIHLLALGWRQLQKKAGAVPRTARMAPADAGDNMVIECRKELNEVNRNTNHQNPAKRKF
jgi:hypothetical protein